MRVAFVFLWFVLVVGGYVTWCALWSNDTIPLDPTPWWWLAFILLFVVPAAFGKSQVESPTDTMAEVQQASAGTRPIPLWVWVFVFACGSASLLSLLGLSGGFREERFLLWCFAALAGIIGAWACVLVGRRRFRSVVGQTFLCFVLTFGAWLPALAAIAQGLGPR